MGSNFWDKKSQKYDVEIQKRDDEYLESLRRTRELIKSDDNILDYGCGSGQIAIDLATDAGFIHGIDYSENMIDLAKTKGASIRNVKFSQVNIFNDALKLGTFNVILAFNILHLVEDPKQALFRASDLLVDGGLLISMTPCLGDRNMIIRALLSLAQTFHLVPSIHYFKVKELQSLVEQTGFIIANSNIFSKKFSTLWLVAEKQSG